MRLLIRLFALLILTSCASEAPTPPPAPLPVPPPVQRDTQLNQWIQGFRQEALTQGIRPQLLDEAFSNFQPIQRVIELDHAQPETTLTFAQYKQNTLPDARIARARDMAQRYAPLLRQIGKQYGVRPEYIVALWGIESDFGRNMGKFPVVYSLATLAYDGRRSQFFRGELMNAFRILNEGHTTLARMQGSWAGAMGQSQFMPSSFVSYAVDYDGDGRKDIWNSQADVFASIANYLSRSGWDADESWGTAVWLPQSARLAEGEKMLRQWNVLGVRWPDGRKLPDSDMKATLVEPGDGSAYLGFPNYKVIMKWNRSKYFATSVGLLADSVKDVL